MKALYGANRIRALSTRTAIPVQYKDIADLLISTLNKTENRSYCYIQTTLKLKDTTAYKWYDEHVPDMPLKGYTRDHLLKALCCCELACVAIKIVATNVPLARMGQLTTNQNKCYNEKVMEDLFTENVPNIYDLDAFACGMWSALSTSISLTQSYCVLKTIFGFYQSYLAAPEQIDIMFENLIAAVAYGKLGKYVPSMFDMIVLKRIFSGNHDYLCRTEDMLEADVLNHLFNKDIAPTKEDCDWSQIGNKSIAAVWFAIRNESVVTCDWSTFKDKLSCRTFFKTFANLYHKDTPTTIEEAYRTATYCPNVVGIHRTYSNMLHELTVGVSRDIQEANVVKEAHKQGSKNSMQHTQDIYELEDKLEDAEMKIAEMARNNKSLEKSLRSEQHKTEELTSKLKTCMDENEFLKTMLKEERSASKVVTEVCYKSSPKDLKRINKLETDNVALQKELAELRKERDELLIYREMHDAEVRDEVISEDPEFTEAEKRLLQTVRVHITGPDNPSIRKLEQMLPASKLTLVPVSHDNAKFNVPSNMDAYIFLTASMSHAECRLWEAQLASQREKRYLCGVLNPVAICHFILDRVLKGVRDK